MSAPKKKRYSLEMLTPQGRLVPVTFEGYGFGPHEELLVIQQGPVWSITHRPTTAAVARVGSRGEAFALATKIMRYVASHGSGKGINSSSLDEVGREIHGTGILPEIQAATREVDGKRRRNPIPSLITLYAAPDDVKAHGESLKRKNSYGEDRFAHRLMNMRDGQSENIDGTVVKRGKGSASFRFTIDGKTMTPEAAIVVLDKIEDKRLEAERAAKAAQERIDIERRRVQIAEHEKQSRERWAEHQAAEARAKEASAADDARRVASGKALSPGYRKRLEEFARRKGASERWAKDGRDWRGTAGQVSGSMSATDFKLVDLGLVEKYAPTHNYVISTAGLDALRLGVYDPPKRASKRRSAASTKKPSDKMREQDRPSVFGQELDRRTLTPVRRQIDTQTPGDYGHDPLGDGTYRMVPSGDIVNYNELARRLWTRAQDAYRSRKIGDNEYLAARAAWEEHQRAFDAAASKPSRKARTASKQRRRIAKGAKRSTKKPAKKCTPATPKKCASILGKRGAAARKRNLRKRTATGSKRRTLSMAEQIKAAERALRGKS